MKTRKPESTHPVDGALPALAGDGREQWQAAVEDPSRSSRRAHTGGGGDGGAGSPSNARSRAVSRAFTRALFPPVATLSSQLATRHLPAPPYASKQALAQPHAPCCRLTALTAHSRRTAKPSQLATMLSNHHLLSQLPALPCCHRNCCQQQPANARQHCLLPKRCTTTGVWDWREHDFDAWRCGVWSRSRLAMHVHTGDVRDALSRGCKLTRCMGVALVQQKE